VAIDKVGGLSCLALEKPEYGSETATNFPSDTFGLWVEQKNDSGQMSELTAG
jgi:hypothetical protein